MPAVEMDDVCVVLQENRLAVDSSIVVGKEAKDVLLVVIRDAVELMHFHLGEMLNNVRRDAECCFTTLARIEELKGSFL